jgi:uncharacterized protein involved in exopolysaccharide biosynthesis
MQGADNEPGADCRGSAACAVTQGEGPHSLHALPDRNESLPSRLDTAPREAGLADVIDVLWAHKLVVFLVTFLTTAAGVAVALLMTPVYRSEILLMPVTSDNTSNPLSSLASQFGGIASLVGLGVQADADKDEALAILQSRAFTTQFIAEHELIPVIFADNYDATRGTWIDPEEVPTMDDAFRVFNENIRSVAVNTQTGLVTLGIEWTDRVAAADWANAMVARVNDIIRERTKEEAQKSIDYLNRELTESSNLALQQNAYGLIEAQVNKIMLANVREEFAFKVIDPAVPAEEGRPVRPRRVLIVGSAGLLGGMLATAVALFLENRKRRRRS